MLSLDVGSILLNVTGEMNLFKYMESFIVYA